MVIKRWKRGE